MADKNNLTESEIHELALAYTKEQFTRGFDIGLFHEKGLMTAESVELEFLFNTYINAYNKLTNLNK